MLLVLLQSLNSPAKASPVISMSTGGLMSEHDGNYWNIKQKTGERDIQAILQSTPLEQSKFLVKNENLGIASGLP